MAPRAREVTDSKDGDDDNNNDAAAEILLQKLKASGEYQRLYNACQAKLMQQDGWKDQLENLALETVRETAPEEVSLQDLVRTLVPVGKSSIPSQVHDELRTLVKESIQRL